MIVAGGCYRELCFFPRWERLFGSGVRAAVALSVLSPGTELHTCVPPDWLDDVTLTLRPLGVGLRSQPARAGVTFRYYHPLRGFGADPEVARDLPPLAVSGEVVLAVGLLECDIKLEANRTVYDPQSSDLFLRDSSVGTLALILNARELHEHGGKKPDPRDNALAVQEATGASLIVMKHPFGGATLFDNEATPVVISAYRSERFFRIGAGDVFAAAFAHFWGERRMHASEAVAAACRAMAHYVDGARLPIPALEDLEVGESRDLSRVPGRVAIVGLASTIGQRWTVDHADDHLRQLGIEARLPVSDARPDEVEDFVAGLGDGDTVLVIAGPGALDWVSLVTGLRRRGARVVLLGEGAPSIVKAAAGSMGALVADDFATALYQTVWEACL